MQILKLGTDFVKPSAVAAALNTPWKLSFKCLNTGWILLELYVQKPALDYVVTMSQEVACALIPSFCKNSHYPSNYLSVNCKISEGTCCKFQQRKQIIKQCTHKTQSISDHWGLQISQKSKKAFAEVWDFQSNHDQ